MIAATAATAVTAESPAGGAPTLSRFPQVGAMAMPAGFAYREVFSRGRPRHRRYDSFWIRHPPMDPGHRAKIFAPFDALRGFDARIWSKEVLFSDQPVLSEDQKEELNKTLSILRSLTYNGNAFRKNRPSVCITWFEPCTDPDHFAYGHQGKCITITGIVSRIDPELSQTITVDEQDIPLEDVCDIHIVSTCGCPKEALINSALP